MEKNDNEERMSKAGEPDWVAFSPASWLSPDSKDSRNQEVHKTFAGNRELKEHLTATYWG